MLIAFDMEFTSFTSNLYDIDLIGTYWYSHPRADERHGKPPPR